MLHAPHMCLHLKACHVCPIMPALVLQAHAAEVGKLGAALEGASEERIAAAAVDAAEQLAARQQALDEAAREVEGAKAELAGIESGDGRDESNRSMPERLRDTEADMVRRSSPHASTHTPGTTCVSRSALALGSS